jgi:hypothetical protein
MTTSPEIHEIANALSLAQGDIKPASKDSTNPHFRSKYADMASVIEAVREPLAKHGLSVVQEMRSALSPSRCPRWTPMAWGRRHRTQNAMHSQGR